MGNPTIFSGRRTKLLTADGLLTRSNRIVDYNGFTDYCPNGHFESPGPIIWATYADAAGVAPVDGTGGSPTVTFTRSTTNPLRGQASGLWTKPASNVQGQGFSIDFTIDRADRGKVISGSLVYEIISGTYDGGLVPYIYDVTNAVVYACAGGALPNVGIQSAYNFTFPAATNSTSYRLIFHQSTTSAVATSITFDDIRYGVQPQSFGVVVDDWVPYTPTITGFGTPTNVVFYSKRQGDMLLIKGAFTSGTSTAVQAQVTLGYQGVNANVVSDPTKVSANNGVVGVGAVSTAGAFSYYTFALPSTNVITIGVASTGTAGFASALGSNIAGSGANFTLEAMVPILGWTSGSVAAQNAPIAPAFGKMPKNSSQATNASASTLITSYATPVADPLGGFSGNGYVFKYSGPYRVSSQWVFSGATNATAGYSLDGGTTITYYGTSEASGSSLDRHQGFDYIMAVAGQTITWHVFSIAASTVSGGWVAVEMVTGNSQIIGQSSPNVNTRTVTATTTASIADDVILCDATAGTVTVNLPACAAAVGKTLVVKKIDASVNTVVLDGSGSETIDGATTKTISTQYNSFRIVSNGTAWSIV